MLKWIIWTIIIYTAVWYFLVTSSYTPLSMQIDVKSMSVSGINYMTREWSICSGDCTDYSSDSSSSSWGWWVSGGK